MADGVDRLVVVPMCAQYGESSTGIMLDELFCCARRRARRLQLEVRTHWHDDTGYIDLLAHAVHHEMRSRAMLSDDLTLVFAAPAAGVRKGHETDPYQSYVRETAEYVLQRLGWPRDRAMLVFDSERDEFFLR